jgi:hypothetical protein
MDVETFQRERPTRQRQEEESAAALKSAKVILAVVHSIARQHAS